MKKYNKLYTLLLTLLLLISITFSGCNLNNPGQPDGPGSSTETESEEIVEIPDIMRAFAIFPYGYPAEERPQQDRFDESRIHYVE